MKIKLLLLFTLFLLLLAVAFLYLIFKTNLLVDDDFCKNAYNLQNINTCINNDMFYHYATKTNDDVFAGGFLTAYNNCQSHNKECNLHDSNVFMDLEKRCALDGHSGCSYNIISDIVNPKVNDENIKIINNTIMKSIQLKYYNPCRNYHSFF